MARIETPAYPWYDVISGRDLQQGDILLGCPVFRIPPDAAFAEDGEWSVQIDRQNVIVLTQSCDLARRDNGRCAVDENLLASVFFKSELADDPTFGKKDKWNEGRKGRLPRYHVLNRCTIDGHHADFMLVDFSRVYSHSTEIVQAVAANQGERIRLLSPYREHLSQAFARFFMRVGLPVDIPEFV